MDWLELLILALAGAGVWLWQDSLKAREAGVQAAQAACRDEGLQFLDDTVAGRGLRLARDEEGRLRIRRAYAFEYSDTGDNRREGSVVLLGQEVEMIHLRPRLYLVPDPRKPHETLH